MDQDEGYKPARPAGETRLGIVHLLGWMAGCAVVLAIYRGTTDWEKIDPAYRATLRVWQLAFGLFYGTALSGLGLLIWRRLRGQTDFPSQAGHWLLVLGGIGFVHDALTTWTAECIFAWSTLSADGLSPYYLQQSLGWGGAALVGLIFCFAKGTPIHWRIFAIVATLAFTANATTHILATSTQLAPYVLQRPLFTGSWPFYLAALSRALGETACICFLPLLVWLDARAGFRRDWLHWAGAIAVTGLGIADVVQNVLILRLF